MVSRETAGASPYYLQGNRTPPTPAAMIGPSQSKTMEMIMGISVLTRQLLLTDGATCAVSGLLLTLGAGLLEPLLGLPEWLLLEVGILLFPAALLAFYAGRRVGVTTGPARLMVTLNLAWVVASLALLLTGWTTALGTGFVLVQALAVTGLALAQIISLRQGSDLVQA